MKEKFVCGSFYLFWDVLTSGYDIKLISFYENDCTKLTISSRIYFADH